MENKTSMYNLMEFWLKYIAPKYYDLEDLSLSNIGIFGYTNEVMAHCVESIANETSVLFNEIFFNKAVLPESILTYAAQQNITDINARPAIMQFALGIREDILLNNLITDEGGNSYFIIDKDTEIIVEDKFKYMLDYDIKINVFHKDGKFIYSGLYKTFDNDHPELKFINPLSDIKEKTNPFLKITKIKHEKDNYIYVFVTARQVEKNIITKTIYKNDFIDYYNYDIEYDGTLADFYVMYKEPNSKHYIQLEKKLLDSAPSHNKFCYYNYRDENTISISFSTLSRYFRPKYNSTLNIVLFTTMGEKANYQYKGNNVRIVPKSDVYDYRNIIILGNHLSDSDGGRDKMSYEQIKQKVQYYASTANNIGTTIDLNKYFKAISKNSKLLFVKKRDDILERLFTSYTLFKDSKKNIMPTNTLNLKIEEKEFDDFEESTQRFILKSGSKFTYDGNNRRMVLNKDAEIGKDKFIFTNPYLMVLNRNPFKIDYYLNSINTKKILDFHFINERTISFISNNIYIKRDAINGEEEYKFIFNLKPNSVIDDRYIVDTDSKGNFIKDTGNLIAKGIIFDDKEEITHYFDFKMIDYIKSDSRMIFEGKIKTDDYISLENFMRTIDSIYKAKHDEKEKDILINASELNLGIAIFLKEDVPLAHKIHNDIPGMNEYSVTNIYKVDGIDLINNMNKIMKTTLLINPYDVNNLEKGYYYLIKEVPVVKYEYIKNYVNDFISACINVNTILREALIHLTNNFSLDFKFYNTYGRSYYFYIEGDKEKLLDRINIGIKLSIKLNPNKLLDEVLRNDIREFIKNYIESINDDQNFYISNIVTELKNKFRDILFIEFKNINDYTTDIQSIERNFPSELFNSNYIRDFVPEYINIDKKYIKNTIVDDMIDIEFI